MGTLRFRRTAIAATCVKGASACAETNSKTTVGWTQQLSHDIALRLPDECRHAQARVWTNQDSRVMLLASLTLCAAAALACIIPARRARSRRRDTHLQRVVTLTLDKSKSIAHVCSADESRQLTQRPGFFTSEPCGRRTWRAQFEFTRINIDVITTSTSNRSA
jgi:hypothetical protein